jgi:hypothetical protein
MRFAVTALFVIVGLINFTPVIGVLGAARLESLYGQPFVGEDLLLLLRHRAVLFGLLGGLLIAAAFRPALRTVAAVAGLVSMVAFVVIALPIDAHGAALQRVFWADVIATPLLALGWWLSARERGGAR